MSAYMRVWVSVSEGVCGWTSNMYTIGLHYREIRFVARSLSAWLTSLFHFLRRLAFWVINKQSVAHRDMCHTLVHINIYSGQVIDSLLIYMHENYLSLVQTFFFLISIPFLWENPLSLIIPERLPAFTGIPICVRMWSFCLLRTPLLSGIQMVEGILKDRW